MGNTRFPSIPLNPMFKPTVLAASAVLGLRDRCVFANNTTAAIFTLPTAPPDGSRFELTQVNATLARVTVTAGGADRIVDAATQSVVLSGYGSTVDLQYSAPTGLWHILNLQRQSLNFRWDSAGTNEYLQRGQVAVLVLGTYTLQYVGGAISSASVVQLLSGTVIVGNLFLQTRANAGANITVKVRSAVSNFSSAADLATNLQATVANGAQAGQSSARSVIVQAPDTASKNWLVLQAVTAIGTPLDIGLDYWTF